MNERKIYIKVNNKNERKIIEEILNETYQELSFSWKDKIAEVSFVDEDSFQSKLKKTLTFCVQDVGLQVKILIVPFFDEIFVKYLDFFNNQVCTMFEIFVRNINSLDVKKDAQKIIQSIEKKDLDTIKAFLSCNCNSLASANELYLHRNSFNYRMNQFVDKYKIDTRDINSLMFLNLLINLNA